MKHKIRNRRILSLGITFIVIVGMVFISGCKNETSVSTSRQEQEQVLKSEGDPGSTITKKQVEFLVHVPDATPTQDTINLVILPFWNWAEIERIPMVSNGDGTWSASTELEEGSLVRYAYDRGYDENFGLLAMRERFSEEVQILYRSLFVSSSTSAVEDTVAMWNDILATPLTGTVSGIIHDKETGKPIMDATVSIGGVHIATNYDGSFSLSSVPQGKQRVTVLTTLGDHKYASQEVLVNPDETSTVNFELEPARKVVVTFNVETPADTPTDAAVRLAGNIFQMGLYPDPDLNFGYTRWSPSRQILMDEVSQNNFTTNVELYEGSYIQYVYTLVGYPDLGDEKTSAGENALRSFIVGAKNETRDESIAAWKNPDQFALTFNVTVPANTPSDATVYIDIGGPYLAMDRVSEKQWTLTFFAYPDSTFTYRYFHSNGQMEMELFEPDDTNTYRTVTVANGDTTLNDTVAQWKWYPVATLPETGSSVNVTFRVTVPLNTSTEDTIYLVGDSAALGSNQDTEAIPMTQVATNPWLWEVTVPFGAAANITYHYTRGDSATAESETRTLSIAYDGQTVNDAVFSWTDIPTSLSRDFISAVYPDDLWEAVYLSLYESTLSRIQSLGADTIVLSSVWSYGQVDPLPEVESRPIKASSVYTPTEDLVSTVNMAHSMGMKAFILPQFNMEMTTGGETVGGAHSNEWWDQWLIEAQKFYLYNAEIAEQTGADMLLLPGPVFQTFPGKEGFENSSYISVFDQKMMDLIGEVREQYSGLILISGAQSSLYEFPGLADLIIITPFDMGTDLNVSSNASVQQIKSAFENILDKKAHAIFEKYNKPVLVQITYPSVDGAATGTIGDSPWDANNPSTKLDVIEQANIYEGFFQAVVDRPWIAGTFDYSYHYFDLPEDESPSIRAKPAEMVLSKYYSAFEQ